MKIKRREFIAASLAGVGGLLAGPGVGAFVEAAARKYDPFDRIALGKTGIKPSRVVMGTGVSGWMRESNLTRLGKERFEALLRNAYERGVRLFDCADLYGTHPYIIPGLKGIPRENFAIQTKIWFSEGGIPDEERPPADVVVERFLKELNTDYIDIVLMHCVVSPNWPTELSDQMGLLDKLKQKGVIRAHGVSCHTLDALKACVNESWVDSVNARINPYAKVMDVEREEDVPKVVSVLKDIHAAGKGVMGMKLVGEGSFRNDPEKKNRSIEFALKLGCVDTMIVGFEKEQEIDDFASRVRQVPVSA